VFNANKFPIIIMYSHNTMITQSKLAYAKPFYNNRRYMGAAVFCAFLFSMAAMLTHHQARRRLPADEGSNPIIKLLKEDIDKNSGKPEAFQVSRNILRQLAVDSLGCNACCAKHNCKPCDKHNAIITHPGILAEEDKESDVFTLQPTSGDDAQRRAKVAKSQAVVAWTKAHDFTIGHVQAEGSCLYRSVSKAITGTQANHFWYRIHALAFLTKHQQDAEYTFAGMSLHDWVVLAEAPTFEEFIKGNVNILEDTTNLMIRCLAWRINCEIFIRDFIFDQQNNMKEPNEERVNSGNRPTVEVIRHNTGSRHHYSLLTKSKTDDASVGDHKSDDSESDISVGEHKSQPVPASEEKADESQSPGKWTCTRTKCSFVNGPSGFCAACGYINPLTQKVRAAFLKMNQPDEGQDTGYTSVSESDISIGTAEPLLAPEQKVDDEQHKSANSSDDSESLQDEQFPELQYVLTRHQRLRDGTK